MATLPVLNPGSRTVISGRTGSGKTTLANFLLSRTRQHWLILNPKHTAGYSQLPNSNVLNRTSKKEKDLEESLKKYQFTILNFPGNESNPEYMDGLVSYLHENYSNIGICADELYTLHSNGRAGPGLIGWLTRGRELKQSWIGLTQRPAWVSRFIFSESDYVCGMDLALQEDRKRMKDNTGHDGFMVRLPPHQWRWYNVKEDVGQLWGPVPIR